MLKITSVLFGTLLFIACGQARVEPKTGDVQSVKTDSIPPESTRQPEPALEPIDMANATKAYIGKDSVIVLTANIRQDHRIIGYEKPATDSRKLILFSVFTAEVEGNPFHCPYGAYYGTDNMEQQLLKFIQNEGDYKKVAILKNGTLQAYIYMENKWLMFD